MGRAPCCQKVGLKKGRWTAEEDEILTNYIAASGEGSWRSLPMNAGLLRCGKSCRLRWINYLKAGLKRGNITHEEEQLIIKLHASLGNRWSLIAGHLPGRTDNEIKNYWNSHLSRRIHSFRRAGNNGETVIMDIGKIPGGRRWRGGRTSRAAMKKNSTILTTTTTGIMRKEKQANNSTAPFDCLDSDHQAGSLTLEELEDMASELLSPSQVLESGAALWATADLGAISEDSVGWEFHGEKEGGLREDDVIRSLDWEMCEGGKEMGPWVWSSEEESGEVMNNQLQGIEGCWPEIESVASWLLSDGDGATLS